ncbi:MAG: DUF4954 family protein [Bacteroidetes bacterium]|nr:DUF4954 family protein [Bacteroidota bacterium]MBU1113855.1 DUF4954 family protein [Bacteroidota bacterium]MBU1799653.1 DUF4954 family protein [Bacteroidota bacterium]
MEYRNLTEKEINILLKNRCQCDNWNNIKVKEKFEPTNIICVNFSGNVKIGILSDTISAHNNIKKTSGIYNSTIINCQINDNIYISNVATLSNYTIGENTIIENVNNIIVSELNSFGVGKNIEILNEGGGREIPLLPNLSSQLAYVLVNYRNDEDLQNSLKKICDIERKIHLSDIGMIGNNVRISNVKEIINVNIADGAIICNATSLKNGSIICNEDSHTYIGANVVADNFIILSGATVDTSVNLENCFVGESTKLGKQFSAENSAFFANCEGYHGEACSIFAGPYTVTHHKSTLLIASYFSFYNAGSGTNQSNHMYKLGPVHQGVLERGAKTGSMSYMLLPSRVGPFSVVIGKHFNNFDASDFPFSYITEENGKSVLTPAMNLFTVGTKRDTEKWAKRDKRKSKIKLDKINFDFYSPYIVGKMENAFNILDNFYNETSKEKEYVKYKGLHIARLLLKTCKKYYDLGIKVGIGEHLIRKLDNADENSIIEIKRELNNKNISKFREKWLDLGGLYLSESDWKGVRKALINEDIKSISQLNDEFEKINISYYSYAWDWFSLLLKEKYTPDSEISNEVLVTVLKEWSVSKLKLLNMILNDAEKEFDINSKISYGIDGDEETRDLDFKYVRGSYQENNFTIQLKEEIEKTNLVTDKLLKLLI